MTGVSTRADLGDPNLTWVLRSHGGTPVAPAHPAGEVSLSIKAKCERSPSPLRGSRGHALSFCYFSPATIIDYPSIPCDPVGESPRPDAQIFECRDFGESLEHF